MSPVCLKTRSHASHNSLDSRPVAKDDRESGQYRVVCNCSHSLVTLAHSKLSFSRVAKLSFSRVASRIQRIAQRLLPCHSWPQAENPANRAIARLRNLKQTDGDAVRNIVRVAPAAPRVLDSFRGDLAVTRWILAPSLRDCARMTKEGGLTRLRKDDKRRWAYAATQG
jgi:hypothetical protein